MKVPFKTQPFLKLLVPIVAGILCQHCLACPFAYVLVLFVLGVLCIAVSFWMPLSQKYSLRFCFGLGVILSFFSVGVFLTTLQQRSVLLPQNAKQKHLAAVLDTPLPKAHTQAYTMLLLPENKKIVVYLKPSSARQTLSPGTELVFDAKIRKFTSYSPFDRFDYRAYMTNRGYSGWIYLKQSSCVVSNQTYHSLSVDAMKLRAKLLTCLHPQQWTTQESALVAALLLGYKGDLDNDTNDAFRISGTIHVLSVSGLHVGIVYLLVLFVFAWLPNTLFLKRISLFLILFCLWFYAFLTGLSPSVVRASVMLSVLCFSGIFVRRSFSLHALYIAAFFLLINNPFSLFDISFQLSFVSVWFILYFYPKLYPKIRVKNRVLNKIVQFSALSLCAQLGVFPLCLYYFGTFPVYFFAANLIVIPLVSLVVYSAVVYLFLSLFSCVHFISYLLSFAALFLHYLLKLLLDLTLWFSQLPCAQLSGLFISPCVVVLVFCAIFVLTHFKRIRKMCGFCGKIIHKVT